ncbi:DUF4153 domain-containing protein [Pedobacter petrophilus]|uniref:DUF4153 domain-containing protein n=1 Tax=Pedobacter petrophilus TaxID=1908241 RepID=A0A7K0FW49_9SPHI|nr:DUF4153 domain-containing protein [Pedobacter petrophilus]MRX75314.1 DUF4153 domain-containing protein [Pedobacter petrophilus]
MKLPSLQHLYQGLIAVIKRFPVQCIFIIIATSCWAFYVNIDNYDNDSNHYRLLNLLVKAIFISNLGLALTLALDLLAEKKQFKLQKKWLIRTLAVLFCILLFFLFDLNNNFSDQLRIALLAFAFHLFVAFSPFMDQGHINGFWQFNKVLFLRFLTAALYSAVLYGGLSIALVAIDGLFNVNIRWQIYLTVFAIIAGGFSPVFFLAGVPRNFQQLDEDVSYPKGLKIFTQFVLIPLMTIYLAILLFYEIKIIISWSLPKGMVSSLIIGYTVFGILSLLLIYPMKDKEGNSWIKLFSRFFYTMLLPLIALLLLAVWKRVGPYGITESRYILIIIAIWLTCITAYFLFSKKENIKVIPISLAIITLLAVYGPQSASGLSGYSQLSRLKTIFNSKSTEALEEKPMIIRYLVSRHGLSVLQGFTKKDLGRIEEAINIKYFRRYAREEAAIDSAFSILKVSSEQSVNSSSEYSFTNSNHEFYDIKGYDYFMNINSYEDVQKVLEGVKIKVDRRSDNDIVVINLGDTEKITVDIAEIFDRAVAQADQEKLKPAKNTREFFVPEKEFSFSKTVNHYQFTYVIESIRGYKSRGNTKGGWFNVEAHLLIRKL